MSTPEPRPDELRTTVFGERDIYSSPWVRLSMLDVQTPDGRRFDHHVVRLRTVAVAAVLNEHNHVLMNWRHRFATGEWGWELPGGIVDAGEDAVATAERETVEETGWRPRALRHLLTFQPAPGMIDMPYSLFITERAEKVGSPTDLEEVGITKWIPIIDVPTLARRNELLGSGTLVALLYILAERRGQP